jgi:hypothetical protein
MSDLLWRCQFRQQPPARYAMRSLQKLNVSLLVPLHVVGEQRTDVLPYVPIAVGFKLNSWKLIIGNGACWYTKQN